MMLYERLPMTLLDIVETYLEEHGFDGLFCDDCGCRLEDGLIPCDILLPLNCTAGYCREGYNEDGEPHFVWSTNRDIPDSGVEA